MMLIMNFHSIRIVLVNTTHPGNIGAAARAMKNMGLSQLFLVNPECFPHAEATARASGADDLLANAQVVNSLDAALLDCTLIIGTSARMRTLPWPELNPKDAAEKIVAESKYSEVAIVFGQERSGLSNEELERCHFLLHIPCNPEYPSLNLAAAVQVVCYEIRMAAQTSLPENIQTNLDDFATATEMQNFYQHLQQTLLDIEFLNVKHPGKMMHRLKRLFNRSRLEVTELNILRGILTQMQKQLSKLS
jgi:tRNA (cytidine32/uridine32-2'-O)-methyltransferase